MTTQTPSDLFGLGMAYDEPKIAPVMSAEDAAYWLNVVVDRLGSRMTPTELFALGMAAAVLKKEAK